MGLYFKYFKVHVKSELQYKMSFIMSFISNIIFFFGYYFTIICLFDKFSNIKGFTVYEVLLTFSIIHFGFSFCEVFFRGIDQFDDFIIDGNFDRLLIRPRNVLYQVACNEICLFKLARLIQAIIVLFIAIIKIDVVWDIEKAITLILMLFSSIIVFLSVFILAAAYCFFTTKGLEVRNVALYGGREMAQYPIGVFKKGFVVFFTCIIPLGFVNYYPLLYILGRTNNKLFIISPIITIIHLIISIAVFYFGMRRYKSVGS